MFRFPYDPSQIDVPACARSGQSFRWKEAAPGIWEGWDGATFWRVATEGAQVESNQPEDAFHAYFQADVRWEDRERELLARDPCLADIALQARTVRVLRPNCATEVFFSFLCSANNHVPRITSLVAKLAARCPNGFPSAERIAEVSERELRSEGFGYRGATLPRAAALLAERGGEGYLQSLKHQPYEAIVDQLREMPGVGRKLADCIALFGLHRDEAVPVDVHVWRQLCARYFPEWRGSPLTELRYRRATDAFRERFGNLSGWAQQWLFVASLRGE